MDVRRLLPLLGAVPSRHRADRWSLARIAGPGHAAGFPAARRTAGNLPKHLQIRQRPGQVAPPAVGLGQGPRSPRPGPLQGAPAGRGPVAGRLLSVLLSPQPPGHAGLRPNSHRIGRHLGRAGGEGAGAGRVRPHVRRRGPLRNARRAEPEAAGRLRVRQDRGPRSARLPGPEDVLSPLRRPRIRSSITAPSWPTAWSNSRS